MGDGLRLDEESPPVSPVRWRVFALPALMLSALPAFAQTTADIVGRVTDASRSVLPGVTVHIEHEGTGGVRSMPTNATGDYAFNLLLPGTYTVTMELDGFNAETRRVTLSSGDRARLDAQLALGSMTETVTVAVEAPLLQTETSTVLALVDDQLVQDLPVNGRNFVELVQTVPGANAGLPNSLASGTRPDDRRNTSAISVNGAQDNQNNHMIDGMDNNERQIGTIGVKPSIEAIAEVRVQTNNYTAEVGRTAGGVINVITKSGTNVFSGSLFGYLRNDRFDSRDFFAATKPTLEQYQAGGSIGGPIAPNRTFFFADFENYSHRSGVTNVITVPTMAMRSGDFSELPAQLYDPLTRLPFAGNQIPATRMSPIARTLIDLYPEPTSASLSANYAGVTDRTQDTMTADFRVDHRFDGNNQMFVRYSWNDVDVYTPSACPIANGIDPGCTGGGTAWPGPNVTGAHGVQVNHTRVFSPSFIAEVRGGYLKVDLLSLPVNYGRALTSQFGIPNGNIEGDDITSGLVPLRFEGYSGLGASNWIPLGQIDDTAQFNLTLTRTAGQHNVRFGGGVILRDYSVFQSEQAIGQLEFSALETSDGAGAGGDAMASFLLGFPNIVSRAYALAVPQYHTNEYSLFVQDDWRANGWLTLNLGLRYDVFTPLREENNRISNFDPVTAQIIIPGRNGVSETAGIATDYSNLAPRLGFAASLTDSLVLRGGYGLSYFPGNITSDATMKNAPFISNRQFQNSTSGVPALRLSDGLPTPEPTDHLNPAGNISAVALDFRSTRVRQFNAILERQIGDNVVGIGYVGSRGDFVAGRINLNLPPVGAGNISARRPYAAQLPGVSNIRVFSSAIESQYDSMQLVFQRRPVGGLGFSFNYTLAHNQRTDGAPWDESVIEKFAADNDVRHRVVLSVTYEMPYRGTGSAGALLSDWQVNGIAYWQAGRPFNVQNASPRTNTGARGDRPNLPGTAEPSNPTYEQWLNPDAFEPQPINTVAINMPERNGFRGPARSQVDLSIFRTIPAGDIDLQLRYEVYNVFNRVNFDNPSGAFGTPTFGRVTRTVSPPRQMQFAAKLLF